MIPRPAPETIDQLRAILLRLEQAPDPSHDTAGVAELKRVLLRRIAELEIAHAIEPATADTPPVPDPAALVPRQS